MTETPIPFDYVRAEGKAGRLASRLMAIVAECESGGIYLAPNKDHERIAMMATPNQVPATNGTVVREMTDARADLRLARVGLLL